jgi:hypothetical protein
MDKLRDKAYSLDVIHEADQEFAKRIADK